MGIKEGDWIGDESDNLDRLRQLRKELTDLQASGGKKYLDSVLRVRYDALMVGMAGKPLSGLDETLAQEYEKGQAYALLYLIDLVPVLLEEFDERINNLVWHSSEMESGDE